MKRITISVADITLCGELNDSETATELWHALPIEGSANTWGEEIYFEIPVVADLEEDARADVAVGEIAYWPTGRAFCVFFGWTPASTDDRPRAASAVNVLGRVVDDATDLKAVTDGALVRLARAE